MDRESDYPTFLLQISFFISFVSVVSSWFNPAVLLATLRLEQFAADLAEVLGPVAVGVGAVAH